jgi:hypothetical protein
MYIVAPEDVREYSQRIEEAIITLWQHDDYISM